MATVCVSACRPIGPVLSNTAVNVVHLLTSRSVPASSLSALLASNPPFENSLSPIERSFSTVTTYLKSCCVRLIKLANDG